MSERIGDYLVNEDGEIVGLAERQEFHVADQGSAEWVLEKLMNHEANLAALEAKKSAIVANLDKIAQDERRRANWLEYRFRDELVEFARQELAGGKKKTWTCPYGSISFRATQPKVEITDMAFAVQWARSIGLGDKVRVKEDVLVSEIKDAILADPPSQGFTVTPAGESVTIKTGIKEKENARSSSSGAA